MGTEAATPKILNQSLVWFRVQIFAPAFSSIAAHGKSNRPDFAKVIQKKWALHEAAPRKDKRNTGGDLRSFPSPHRVMKMVDMHETRPGGQPIFACCTHGNKRTSSDHDE